MNVHYKKTSVIDSEGEIVDDRVSKFYNPFKKGKGYKFKYKSVTIKSYLGLELPECFSDVECGKLYRLSKKIYSDSNLLAYRSNNVIAPLIKQEIQIMVGLHRTKFNPFWNKVLKNGIIKPILIDGKEYYCFNPLYYNTTNYLPLYLYIAFQKELKEHLPEWVIQKYLDMKQETDLEGEVHE